MTVPVPRPSGFARRHRLADNEEHEVPAMRRGLVFVSAAALAAAAYVTAGASGTAPLAPGSPPAAQAAPSGTTLPLNRIKLPPGFGIEVYATGVNNARSMTRGDKGTIFVGTRRGQDVFALVDGDNDQKAEKVVKLLSGLTTPNGVAFRNGSLYVAQVNRVLRYDSIESRLDNPPPPVVVNDTFPTDAHHGWKFVRFGPDGKLYVPVGAPCNICDRQDKPYATIMRMNADGSGLEIFARGVRNTVGFDWHPVTKELWFTDNGRDMLGDNVPPDELNRVTQAGQHFGYPYCHAGTVADPEFGKDKPCANYVAPAQNLGPHVAAIGMRFYTGTMFPAEYRNQIFIAEHGSWNRTTPLGYRITVARLDANSQVTQYEIFAEGWLQGAKAWGRPADVEVMPDGALLVSDDEANVVYRITYKG
jgi:glucose/arabinose dehydrogenase